MDRQLDKYFKIITVFFFLGFIFVIPFITLLTPDKAVSQIENKILSQKPKLSLERILNKKFMDNFSSYVTDQFPARVEFIKCKNIFSYGLGNREFRNIYITNNYRLLEKFHTNKNIINNNISTLYNTSLDISKEFGVNSSLMLVPTSSEIYREKLPSWAINDSQRDTLDFIESYIEQLNKEFSSNFNFYTPLDPLIEYKNYPIYFNTDHHWTQLGARIAYEDFKGHPINIDDLLSDNYVSVSNSFLGTYYSKAILPGITPDPIYSFKDFGNFKMESDFMNTYNSLYGDNLLNGKNKYQYFLHGDPGYALIQGKGTKEILVVKDSFAHAFIPFLTQDYSKIHVIDTRYYKVNLKDYINQNPNIDNILYLYNLQTFNGETL